MKFDFPNVFCGNKLESSCLPGRKPNPPVKVRSFLGDNKHLCVCVPDKLRFLLTSHPSGQRADFTWQTLDRGHLTFLPTTAQLCLEPEFHVPWTVLAFLESVETGLFFTVTLSLILCLNAPLFSE